jgi:hypothetical protein
MGDNFFSGIDIKLFDGDKPKKNADGLKVNADGSVDLNGKNAVQALMAKGTVLMFTQLPGDAAAYTWQASGDFVTSLRKAGITKHYSDLNQETITQIDDYIKNYYIPFENDLGDTKRDIKDIEAEIEATRNSNELSQNEKTQKFKELSKELSDKNLHAEGIQVTQDENIKRAAQPNEEIVPNEKMRRAISEAWVTAQINYERTGIAIIPQKQMGHAEVSTDLRDLTDKRAENTKSKEEYKKEKQEIKRDDSLTREEKEAALDSIKEEMKAGYLTTRIQVELKNQAFHMIEILNREMAAEFKRSNRSQKISVNCDLMQMCNMGLDQSFKDLSALDEMAEVRYGESNISTVIVLSSFNLAEFERKLLSGEIKDPPEYMVVTGDGEFGKETVYSTKERLKYLKAQAILADKSVETSYVAPEFGKTRNKEISIGG